VNERRLNDRLMQLAEPFLERVASAAVDDLRARYDFGITLAALREATRGSQLIDAVARTLEVDPSALRRIAHTTEVISADEFEWLTTIRTSGGKALVWSQIELLAREGNARRRRQLALAVVREDLSVRALAKRIVRAA
jgi:hypothetical protein